MEERKGRVVRFGFALRSPYVLEDIMFHRMTLVHLFSIPRQGTRGVYLAFE